ncbi:hypothetical protein [Ktedonobacter racemifer]|uniref:Uncharacterized protein n=1 Tax=Ktedonobacter racemifer DSM 44963 TaxID=485913 RepID=D6U5R6_KTERA|nr:hypothetical protein [Ktedonobacter racemifer]EFH80327.1 hypothetical protein Krac_0918 [Ktedonobacter racemifer DSM 44963]
MSDYYEYAINCTFSSSLDPHLLDTLRYLVRTHEYAFDAPSDHPFFGAEEFEGQRYEAWRDILQVDPDEERGYFARFFRVHSSRTQWSTASEAPYILSFQIAVHDDAEGDVWRLLQWLATISDSQGFVGYSIRQGHGVSEHPRLWYFENQQLVSR